MHKIIENALSESDIKANDKSIEYANAFLEKHDLNPSYAEIHQCSCVSIVWHIKNKTISAVLFEKNGDIVWNYFNRKTNQRGQGTMRFSDFADSDLESFIKDNFIK